MGLEDGHFCAILWGEERGKSSDSQPRGLISPSFKCPSSHSFLGLLFLVVATFKGGNGYNRDWRTMTSNKEDLVEVFRRKGRL